jgi:protocatechuate 4,5-dioxygenase, alpha chain
MYETPESNPPDYNDIPGTFVFDATHSRTGYRLNMFCMSLNDEANRAAFRANETAYLDRYTLSAEQRSAVLERGWIRLLELGGNIYYTFKLAACDGLSFQQLAALQTGVSEADYVAMMLAGGRSIEGNRSRSEPNWVVADKPVDLATDGGTPFTSAHAEGARRG